jgi:nicotinamide mononucleotide transporter
MKSILSLCWEQIGGYVGLVAYVTSIFSVVYAIRNKIATWPWGIVSVILFGKIFLDAKDPLNAGLQVLYYLPISIYGWYIWLRGGPKHADDLPVTTISNRARVVWIFATVVTSVLLGAIEAHYKKSDLPFTDATTTVISIVAQYLQTRKKFENWITWIVVDIIYAFWMFPKQHLMGLATLYVLFLIMAFQGAYQWWAIMKSPQAAPETAKAAESSV